MQSISIAYLGPAGTYSDEAAHRFEERLAKSNCEYVACNSFDEIFELVERGKVDYGVVPMENSLEGAVTATLDNFAHSQGIKIVGEEVLAIHHNLVIAPNATIDDITTIASHPQGLGQCRRYLSRHLPGRHTITTSSTASSAQKAVEDPTIGGIANAYAAELYGAVIAESEIEDHSGNETKFALITRDNVKNPLSGDSYKTSLALYLKADKAGALLMILSEFAYANINLTMIQSRPTKQGLGDYMFFVDIEGRIDDQDIQTALACLRMKLREVKVLGSYPATI